MADLLSRHLEHVEVVTHPETGLPHLRYSHRADAITVATGSTDGHQPSIDDDELGPVGRAWYGAGERP